MAARYSDTRLVDIQLMVFNSFLAMLMHATPLNPTKALFYLFELIVQEGHVGMLNLGFSQDLFSLLDFRILLKREARFLVLMLLSAEYFLFSFWRRIATERKYS